MLLLTALPNLEAALNGAGPTTVYESCFVGPHGFVPWPAAESIELETTPDSLQELCFGAYRGRNWRIEIPPEQSEIIRQLVTRLQRVAEVASAGRVL
ncbi:hypothetical protein [Fuerstiella marisgermanici]|uniref:hypothetical protein n=1 Tax=Fuerstiella marisgermanici TaxID=1891926 RepID=UPI00097C0BBF|nr:hypothetical protein [Fuerstiella marisgermanici]